MTAKIISLNEWKKRKKETLGSMVPPEYGSLDDFLNYCKFKNFFNREYANALYGMAELSLDKKQIIDPDNICISRQEMENIIGIINQKRKSIEVKFEMVD